MTAQLKKGFTLIELLLVVLIISLLAVAVFVSLNPTKRLSDSRNAKRTADVDTLLSAIHSSIVDNKGTLPTNLAAAGLNQVQLGTAGSGCNNPGTCTIAETACTNLLTGTDNIQAYVKSMPVDPTGGTTYDSTKTGYAVQVDTNGIVTVTACGAEGMTITASR